MSRTSRMATTQQDAWRRCVAAACVACAACAASGCGLTTGPADGASGDAAVEDLAYDGNAVAVAARFAGRYRGTSHTDNLATEPPDAGFTPFPDQTVELSVEPRTDGQLAIALPCDGGGRLVLAAQVVGVDRANVVPGPFIERCILVFGPAVVDRGAVQIRGDRLTFELVLTEYIGIPDAGGIGVTARRSFDGVRQ